MLFSYFGTNPVELWGFLQKHGASERGFSEVRFAEVPIVTWYRSYTNPDFDTFSTAVIAGTKF